MKARRAGILMVATLVAAALALVDSDQQPAVVQPEPAGAPLHLKLDRVLPGQARAAALVVLEARPGRMQLQPALQLAQAIAFAAIPQAAAQTRLPDGESVEPTAPAPAAAAAVAAAAAAPPAAAYAPGGPLRLEVLAQPRDIGAPGDLFGSRSWFIPPPPPPPPPPLPPVVPTAPPLPFRFLGSMVEPGGAITYFLGRGTSLIDAIAGKDIDAEYRLDRAADGQLHFIYKPMQAKQTLAIGDPP